MRVHYSHGSLQRYISGYRLAAEHLSSQLIDAGPNHHELIYPIVFLYRQYVELQLKSIVNDGRIILRIGDGFPQHHKLRELWDLARELMLRVAINVHGATSSHLPNHSIAVIGTAIADFAALDPRAISFRYPDCGPASVRLDGGDFIEIEILSQRMRIVSDKLADLDLACALLLEYQEQMAAAHGADA